MAEVGISDLNWAAVVVAGIASFLASGVWYAVFGGPMARLQQKWRGSATPEARPGAYAGLAAVQLVLAAVVAYVYLLVGVSGLAESVLMAVVLWLGLCATQWASSILGEGVPIRLAAIHGGDWLLHLLIIGGIVGNWQ